MTQPTAADRRTGAAAVAAGVLLSASVAAELVWPVQRARRHGDRPPGFALYLAAWTAGAVALVVALLGLGTVGRPAPPQRSHRPRDRLAGAVLLVAFGVVALVTALVAGAPRSGRSCSSRSACC